MSRPGPGRSDEAGDRVERVVDEVRLIWARRARTSASIARVRDASSSASSSCPETHCAISSAARARPAVGYGRRRRGCRRDVRRPPAADHCATDRAAGTSHGGSRRRSSACGPADRGRDQCGHLRAVVVTGAVPGQAGRGVGEGQGRCPSSPQVPDRTLGARPVSPSRSAGEASEAGGGWRKVARSASEPRCVRRHTRMGTAWLIGGVWVWVLALVASPPGPRRR